MLRNKNKNALKFMQYIWCVVSVLIPLPISRLHQANTWDVSRQRFCVLVFSGYLSLWHGPLVCVKHVNKKT